MGISLKKTLMMLAGLLILSLAVAAVFFYIGLSGNPLVGLSEKHACLAYYEQTYQKSFVVYSSAYDYKRGLFEFDIGPQDRPEIRFQTSVDEVNTNDGYGARLAEYHLERIVSDVLSPGYGHLDLTISAHEAMIPFNITETDPAVRLTQNDYNIFVGWKDSSLLSETAQAIANAMAEEINAALPENAPSIGMHFKVEKGPADYWFYDIPGNAPVD